MKYPLFFTYTDLVETDRWSAILVARGRCLMAFEDEEWWIEAVQPGGFTGHGPLPAIAVQKFRNAWKEIVEDIAQGMGSLSEFERELRTQFAQISHPADQDWCEARQQIRDGAPVAAPFDSLRREIEAFEATFELSVPEPSTAPEPVFDEIILPLPHAA